MRLRVALFTATAAVLLAGSAQAASVELRDAAARVTVVPEDRTDIRVEIVTPNAKLPLTVSQRGDRTIVQGDIRNRLRNCDTSGESGIKLRGEGRVRREDLPQVVIHTPRDVDITSNGAIIGAIGRSASLELHDSGCSGWTVADVAGDVELHTSGAGSIRMGASDRLNIHLSGASNVHATQVRRGLEAGLSGAGSLKVDTLTGSMDAHLSGVGQIKVAGGRASSMRASVSGLGGVDFGGAADSLDASISGLGNVRVKEVTGSVSKSVSGIGHVTIENRRL